MAVTIAGTTITFNDSTVQQSACRVIQTKYVDWGRINYTGNSSTTVDLTGFSATFTPRYATSSVLVQVQAGVNLLCDGVICLKRNGTIVKDYWFSSTRGDEYYDYPNTMAAYLDSPATTSTITYQIAGRATGCSNTIRFGTTVSGYEGSSNITFFEVAP